MTVESVIARTITSSVIVFFLCCCCCCLCVFYHVVVCLFICTREAKRAYESREPACSPYAPSSYCSTPRTSGM